MAISLAVVPPFTSNHTFSPTVLTSVRAAWNQSRTGNLNPAVAGQDNLNRTFGIQGVDQETAGGFAQFSPSGFRNFGGSAFTGVDKDSQNWQIKSDTTLIRGDHTIKAGVDILRQENNVIDPQRANGVFSFNGNFTNNPLSGEGGNGFADFLLGIPSQFRVSDIRRTFQTGWYMAGYVQDDWQVGPGMTLNAGVRYDLILPPVERFNRLANVNIDADPVNPPLELAQEGSEGRMSESLVATDANNFAPRIGLAWQLRPSLVLRAGYGVFYEVNDSTPILPLQARETSTPNAESKPSPFPDLMVERSHRSLIWPVMSHRAARSFTHCRQKSKSAFPRD